MKRIDDLLSRLNAGRSVENADTLEKGTSLSERDINALKSQAELDALTISNKLQSEELAGKEQDRKQRKILAWVAFGFLVAYMLCVFLILFFVGDEDRKFSLDNSVLITLLTTTTANIIGIFAFVMKYLFNPKGNQVRKE